MKYIKISISPEQKQAIRNAVDHLQGMTPRFVEELGKPILTESLGLIIKDECSQAGIPIPSTKLVNQYLIRHGFVKTNTYVWRKPQLCQEGE